MEIPNEEKKAGQETKARLDGSSPAPRGANPFAALHSLRKVIADYLDLLKDYRILFLAGVILFLPSILAPSLANLSAAPTICGALMLCTHGSTPWGAVTSVFLYDAWANIPAYFAILATYVAFSDSIGPDERRNRGRFAAVTIFPVATLANVLWMLARPTTYSWGPSGVVYALWGILFAFTLQDGLPQHAKHLDPRTWYNSKKETSSALSNLAIFAATAMIMVVEPAQFLSAGPNINVFAHGVSFLGGYFLTNAYRWARKPTETGNPNDPREIEHDS